VDTETPRPEKLILNLDTTVNSTPTDISGNGYHGKFVGGASYSAGDKAFVADGVSQYVLVGPSTVLESIRGDKSHTISLWVKFDTIPGGSSRTWIFHGGRSAHSTYATIIYINPGSSEGDGFFFNGDPTDPNPITSGDTALVVHKWYHVTAVYDSVDSKGYMYVDGILKDSDTMANFNNYAGNSTSGYIDGQVQLGGAASTPAASTQGLNYSNIKLYSVALEASEVLKLYRLGRTGRSRVICDTAVGIGKAPEAQLDVRGVLKCDVLRTNNLFPKVFAFSAYWRSQSSYDTSTTGVYLPNATYYNYGNCYNTANGLFTAPINGIYHVEWNSHTGNGAGNNSKIKLLKNSIGFLQKGPSVERHGQCLSASLYLTAGDNICISGESSYPLYYYTVEGYHHYSVYLVSAM
jgi:hypothetical protein